MLELIGHQTRAFDLMDLHRSHEFRCHFVVSDDQVQFQELVQVCENLTSTIFPPARGLLPTELESQEILRILAGGFS